MATSQFIHISYNYYRKAKSIKSAMAEVLCKAPVTTCSGADHLLNVFTVEQSQQFLAKARDCVTNCNSVNDVTTCRMNSDRGKCLVCDTYLMSCLPKFRCTALGVCEDVWYETVIFQWICSHCQHQLSVKRGLSGTAECCAESGEHIHGLLQSIPAPTPHIIIHKVQVVASTYSIWCRKLKW